MRTILVAAQKGGVGKTTLVTNLSAALPGRSAIIDIDPQRSAYEWVKLRKQNGIAGTLDAIGCDARDVGKWKDAAAKNGTDWLLIDSVGTSSSGLIEAARVADMILMPTFVNTLDITAIKNTLRFLKAFNVPKFVVLNCVGHLFGFQNREIRATKSIKAFGGTLADVRLSSLVAFSEAMVFGQTAREFKPGGDAGKQVDALAAFAVARLAE